MNKSLVTICLLALSATSKSMGQGGSKPIAPVLPAAMSPGERGELLHVEVALAKGEFTKAGEILKPLAIESVTHVFVNYAAVPADHRGRYRQAIQEAVQAWNAGLAGATKFDFVDQVDGANLVILFERDIAQIMFGQARLVCGDVKIALNATAGAADARSQSPALPLSTVIKTGVPPVTPQTSIQPGIQTTLARPQPGRRYAEARIALLQPYSPCLHSVGAIGHEVAQAIGAYLGLPTGGKPGTLMGMDLHDLDAIAKPSSSDLALFKQIHQTRAKLMEYAQQRVAIYLPMAKMSVSSTEENAGDVMAGDSPHYTFTIKNSGDAPLEIFAKPNCGCTLANYDKVVPAGGVGKIEAVFNSSGFSGRIIKLIDVTSNDPEKPSASLRIVANVLPIVSILPSATPTFSLKDGEPTVKELQIQVNEKTAVQISNVVCNVPYAAAEVVPSDPPSNNNFKLRLIISKDAPLGRSVITVNGRTTSARQSQFVLVAVCEKGIMAVPTSVFLGNISAKTTLPVMQIVTVARKEGLFKINKVSSDDPNLEATVTPIREGSEYQIKVAYKGGWQAGQIYRKLSIQTDDSRQPALEVMVLAFVETATAAAGK